MSEPNEPIEDQYRIDPYGTAIHVIREALTTVLDDGVSGNMSETEYQNLTKIAMAFVEATGDNLDTLGPR